MPQCQVVQVKTEEGEGKYALQIGSGDVKLKHTTKPLMGHFARAGMFLYFLFMYLFAKLFMVIDLVKLN